jgi:hypothetical protein
MTTPPRKPKRPKPQRKTVDLMLARYIVADLAEQVYALQRKAESALAALNTAQREYGK